MKSAVLYEDHQEQQKGTPLPFRPLKTLAKWAAPLAAAALLLEQPAAQATQPTAANPKPTQTTHPQDPQEAFLFGESHGDKPSAKYMEKYLKELKKEGYTSFAVELPKGIEAEFKELLNGPTKGNTLYLNNWFPVNISPEILQVSKQAKDLGMDIHCIDSDKPEDYVKNLQDIVDLTKAYKGGTLSEKDFAQKIERTFDPRNQIMAKNLQGIPGKTAAVVGALHTGGKNSLNDLLEKKGIPTKTLDLIPKDTTGPAQIAESRQKPADVIVRNPEKGVQKEHKSILDDPITPEILEKTLESYTPKTSEMEPSPNKKKQKTKENPESLGGMSLS